MFERRLKIFLMVILMMAFVIVLRAAQVQLLQSEQWKTKAEAGRVRDTLVDAPRGRILDRHGRPIAYDAPCIDAAVDFRAISLEPKWLEQQAKLRLPSKTEAAATGIPKKQLLDEAVEEVKADIQRMWQMLAEKSGKSLEEITETREEISRRVALLQRNAWYRRYAKITGTEGKAPSPWYERWLVDVKTSDPERQHEEALDAAKLTVGEQTMAHVIVPEISTEMENVLRKKLPRCPGLELRQSTHRKYDDKAAVAACHLMGRLSSVEPKDLTTPENLKPENERRKYITRDFIGRAGLEGLGEGVLRGLRGQMSVRDGDKKPVLELASISGKDVTSSIDIDLQADILENFKTLRTWNGREAREEIIHELHGAAVIIDVQSSEVLAMASYPTFDLNQLAAEGGKLIADDINSPLLNRATLAQHEPGSTAKTMIGAVAATSGAQPYDQGIECTGYLIIPDRRTGKLRRIAGTNRCWTVGVVANRLDISPAHHLFPRPHVGRYGNLDGHLVLADALERSCNIYFQTVADKLHLDGVHDAFWRFGLGRPTGIGIPEASGRLPEIHPDAVGLRESDGDRHKSWLAGIGQGQVLATPLQMANVAATFARNGVWMQPRLLHGESATKVYDSKTTRNLNISQIALQATKEGMIAVVNGSAGTGKEAARKDMIVAAKTGSAQASKFSVPLRDEVGQIIYDPQTIGPGLKKKPLYRVFTPGFKDRPSELPWFYQGVGANGEHLAHAWYIGYAPADNPKIAFCAFVEYGGSGGQVAGALAREMIEASVKRGYLKPSQGLTE